MSSLNSFGSILTHAIELETRLRDYYTSAGNEERAKAAEDRRLKLERVRRESVLEITLEPIEGLHENDYALNLGDSSTDGQKAAEGVATKFYNDVAPKINVREARRALERIGKQHGELA